MNSFIGKFPLLGFKSEANVITLDTSHIIRRGTRKEIQEISRRIDLSNHKSFKYILVYSYSSNEALFYPEEIINHFKILNVFFKIFKTGSIGIPYCNHYIKNEEHNKHSSVGFISDPRLQYYEEDPYTISRQETFCKQ